MKFCRVGCATIVLENLEKYEIPPFSHTGFLRLHRRQALRSSARTDNVMKELVMSARRQSSHKTPGGGGMHGKVKGWPSQSARDTIRPAHQNARASRISGRAPSSSPTTKRPTTPESSVDP